MRDQGSTPGEAPTYSPGCIWSSLILSALIITFTVWAVMDHNAIYAPVNEANKKGVREAEGASIDAQHDAAVERARERLAERRENGGNTRRQRMSFADCMARIAGTAEATGQRPTMIEDTGTRQVARFRFNDGNVTISCSRADDAMTLTHTPR